MIAKPPVINHEDQITLGAPAKQVWDAIKDFDAIHTCHPAAVSTEMLLGENGQPLAVREFQTADGGFVISELLEYDEARRRFKYRIIKTSLPLRGYVAEMQVVPTDDGCTVRWCATFHEEQRPAFGDRFVGRVNEVLQRLEQALALYPVWPGTEAGPVRIHKAVLDQFPYLVAFELHTESVLVLAVAHAKRQPLYWLARTSQRPG
jgi:hypothetical protein